MALVIAIVIFSFIWIYVRVGPLLSDFIPSSGAATAIPGVASASPTATASLPGQAVPATPTAAALVATPTPTPVWKATHVIAPDRPNINFRAGPSTLSDRVGSLPPGTELQFLGDQQDTGGLVWMKFETKDGKVGWVRKIDVVPVATATP